MYCLLWNQNTIYVLHLFFVTLVCILVCTTKYVVSSNLIIAVGWFNIKMPCYQYRDFHYKGCILTMEIPMLVTRNLLLNQPGLLWYGAASNSSLAVLHNLITCWDLLVMFDWKGWRSKMQLSFGGIVSYTNTCTRPKDFASNPTNKCDLRLVIYQTLEWT